MDSWEGALLMFEALPIVLALLAVDGLAVDGLSFIGEPSRNGGSEPSSRKPIRLETISMVWIQHQHQVLAMFNPFLHSREKMALRCDPLDQFARD
jgi:hypothetical protein